MWVELRSRWPEQLLDVADVGPPFDHQGGGRVAEQVAAPGLAHVGGVDVAVHLTGQPGGPEALAVGGQEHRAGVLAASSCGRASAR